MPESIAEPELVAAAAPAPLDPVASVADLAIECGDKEAELPHARALGRVINSVQDIAILARKCKSPTVRRRPIDGGKRFAVAVCRYLYRMYRDDLPTTYDDGNFQRLCEAMYGLSTGKRDVDLSRHIRKVLRDIPDIDFSRSQDVS